VPSLPKHSRTWRATFVVSIYLLGILALKSANGCGKVPDKAPPFSNIVGGIDFTNSDIEIAAFAVSECRNELVNLAGVISSAFTSENWPSLG